VEKVASRFFRARRAISTVVEPPASGTHEIKESFVIDRLIGTVTNEEPYIASYTRPYIGKQ